MARLEEVYARATAAITRVRAPCLIMGPLDMKGLLGTATVMGSSCIVLPTFIFMIMSFLALVQMTPSLMWSCFAN